MAIRTLWVDDISVATFEVRRSRRRGLLQRFRYFIENSDWDEHILRHAKLVDAVSLVGAIAAAFYVLSIGVRILG